MRKILFIAHDDLSGGSGRALYDQLLLLKQKPDFFPIVVTMKKNSLYDSLKKNNVEVHFCKYDFTSVWNTFRIFLYLKWFCYRSFFNFFALRKLKKEIDFKSVSLVVSNSSVVGLGAYIYEKMKVPHIWYVREFGDDLVPLVKNLGKYIDSHCDCVISVSRAVADRWAEKGVSLDKITVVYDGVRKPNPRVKARPKDDLIRMCMCGRISKFKGQRYAIQALSMMPKDVRCKFQLDFFGKGYEEIYLKRLVKKYDLEDYVRFRGFSENLDQELYNYDIGLNLTQKEGFGRTTVEYLLHGLYVIGCNSGATPELLSYGKFGSLVQYGDVNAIFNALNQFRQRKNRIDGISQKEYAEANFVMEYNSFKIEQIYKDYIA